MKEEIQWIANSDAKPDSDTTVLVVAPYASEPVWLGYWDDAAQTWYSVDGDDMIAVTYWATMPVGLGIPDFHAVAWASGLIQVLHEVPEGAVSVCRGPRAVVTQFMEVTSRLSKDSQFFSVPGVREAKDQSTAMDALIAHTGWLKTCAPAGVKFGGVK
jgi:DNA-binding beta-propeller fold protein YncE